ncbi:MAG: hypothetical protein AAF702_05165 [Chloroflexota bacterium]
MPHKRKASQKKEAPSKPAEVVAEQPSLFAVAEVLAEAQQILDEAEVAAEEDFALAEVTTASGLKAKAEDLLAAIRLLKTLEAEERDATAAEKRVLARFTGFGAVANHIFPEPGTDTFKEGWQEIGQELATLLTLDEYASAKRSTFNAFYTSPVVMQSIYAALAHMGVGGEGIRVLEPGCGVGNFMGMAPDGMDFVGIEMESLSGRIAQKLYPDHDIRIQNFKETKLPQGSIDVVVGNVPFADLKMDFNGKPLALHDYFFAKSLTTMRDEGVMALVTSRYTMDKLDSSFREYLGEQADFLGAIRLPSTAFKHEGTSVVTDIIFLRKRAQGVEPQHAGNWLETQTLMPDEDGTRHNRYFADHPEMVAGSITAGRGMYQNHEILVEPQDGPLDETLAHIVQALPPGCYRPRDEPLPQLAQAVSPTTQSAYQRSYSPGAFLIGSDGHILQVVDEAGTTQPVLHGQTPLHSLTGTIGKRLTALIEIRDAAREVLWSQNEQRPDKEREAARRRLNQKYDRFVGQWGPINQTTISTRSDGTTVRRMPNVSKFRDDPDAYLVMALEKYDEKSNSAQKMPIMLRDVVGPAEQVRDVASALDGLLVSLNERGKVDIDFISQLYGADSETVVAELSSRIYFNPVQNEYVTAEAYLSGNVRQKLKQAQAYDGEWEISANVAALEDALPDDVTPGDIDPNLGAPWIPAEVIQQFAAQLLDCHLDEIQVAHAGQEALWRVRASASVTHSAASVSTYGTLDRSAIDLLNDALNLRVPTVYKLVQGVDGEQRVVDQTATLAAREKLTAIKEQFSSWIFADHERTDVLVRRYNDSFNTHRLRAYDGSHLTFPGMNPEITLRPHQVDAVWRTMSGGNTLLAHVVGAGKTFEMIASGMKMVQTGLVRKPLYVVPNHMLEQFAHEFYLLYPNANLLVASKEDLTEGKRKLFTAKVASGEWDGVIMTHSSFSKIGMSPAFQRSFLKEQIDDYETLLTDMRGSMSDDAGKRLIKQIEKKKLTLEERLEKLMSVESKDSGLTFEDLGVDHLYIDEAHLFKNLETPTKMDRVAGVQTQGSQRSLDLLMKTRYLDEQTPGRGLTFATGTPISNSMVEMYTMQRFLAPKELHERGIAHFDAWAAVFGDVVDSIELSPDGKSLRSNRRFTRFINLPELLQLFHDFADVKTAEMLNLPRPTLKGGEVQTVACPMSDEQRAIQQKLVERYERVRSGGVDPRDDNALKITTDGRKLALDARLVYPTLSEFDEGKIEAVVEKVCAIWEDTADNRATQMIFCDMGVSSKDGRFSVYEAIIAKLEERGIPSDQIANIGDYKTDAKKAQLFGQVRKGDVRVLLGSTSKMGTGTNVQERLVALHHLDAPWKPAEVEQREGRILRQGNRHEEVAIYRYVTEGSFDAYMWQTLETKAGFINQVMTGETSIRRMDDIDEQALSYAEVKAIASGNPAMLTLAKMEMEQGRLARLQRAHQDEQYQLRHTVRELAETELPFLQKRLALLGNDLNTLTQHGGPEQPELVFNGQPIPDIFAATQTLKAMLQTAWEQMTAKLEDTPPGAKESVQLGTVGGIPLTFTMEKDDGMRAYLTLHGETRHKQTLRSPNSDKLPDYLTRLTDKLQETHTHTHESLVTAKEKLAAFEARLGQPFKDSDRLAQLTEIRTVLQALLQDEVSLEKIYERHGKSGNIPRCENEASLTSALVDGFERWMRGEQVIAQIRQGAMVEQATAAVHTDLADVAGGLVQQAVITAAA